MIAVQIIWHVNLTRGDRFAHGWLPAAEAVLDFGATDWSFYRSHDGRLDFIQWATFPQKGDFDRYWYSELIAEKRVEMAGYYQVPLLPQFYELVGEGSALALPTG